MEVSWILVIETSLIEREKITTDAPPNLCITAINPDEDTTHLCIVVGDLRAGQDVQRLVY
jgi:hypothetical protein